MNATVQAAAVGIRNVSRATTAPAPSWIDEERRQRGLEVRITVTNDTETILTIPAGTPLTEIIAAITNDYPDARFDGLDLAIWRNGYLVAVIRQGRDGKPILTCFDFEWQD